MSSFWNGKRVLVTGATGFVGSWLSRILLERKAHVVAFVRGFDPQSEFFRSKDYLHTSLAHGALEDYNSLENAINEHEIDTVFHIGAQAIVGTAHRSPLPTFEANIRGTYHLLEACRRLGSLVKRVIVASSDKAYGSSDELPYTEEMPLAGKHPYDVSKSCTDLLSFTYQHTYGVPVTVARCGNIYGGGDLHWSRLIPGTIRSYLSDEAPLLRSDGKFTRDYIYVEDVAEAYLTLGENLHRPEVRGEAFNFAPNAPYSVLEIVEALRLLMNKHSLPPKILATASCEIREQSLSYQKALRVLDWKPKFSLEEGLRRTIPWYERYLSMTGIAQ
ncbi:MAG TPA: GDP-mannose 4,6-dehydratase [Chlamydiales bacterium]|nr:GDP-mannose 4,6-dehydratase [Chlamydiales bacterium]